MKVDAKLVVELRREVGLQIERVRRMIEKEGARESWLLSLYRLKTLKKLLTGLLNDGELILANDGYDNQKREGFMWRLARFFRMVNPDEWEGR